MCGSSSYVKLVTYIYFCFFACYNCNAEPTLLGVDISIAKAFLFKIFSAVIAFSILKITTQKQQLQVCRIGYLYLFIFF